MSPPIRTRGGQRACRSSPTAWAGWDRCSCGSTPRSGRRGCDRGCSIGDRERPSPTTDTDVDGLPTAVGPAPSGATPPAADGALGVTGIDHVVVLTPDLDRTIAAVEDQVGVPLLRIRDGEAGGSPVRQAFFRLGEVVLEVVSAESPEPGGDGPARFYGLALTVRDLDAAAHHLGDLLGPVKPAVQRDRHIATVRREAGLGAAVALMSPAPERA